MKAWSIVVLMTCCAPAAMAAVGDRPPIYIAGGLDYLTAESRSLTGSPIHAPHLAAGWSDNTPALFGIPSLDIDWAHAAGNGNAIDTFGLTYNERRLLTQNLYFGLGIGTFYSRIKLTDPFGDTATSSAFRIGGRGMLGYDITSSIFLEATYFYSGTVAGVNTNCIAGCLGIWF